MDLQSYISEITAPIPNDKRLPTVIYPQSNLTSPEKITHLLTEINQAKDSCLMGLVLYYAYLIGEIIVCEEEYGTRKTCLRMLTQHYRAVTKRAYYLFGHDRTPLVLNCRKLSLTSIKHLSLSEYNQLLEAAEQATLEKYIGPARPNEEVIEATEHVNLEQYIDRTTLDPIVEIADVIEEDLEN
jgi:hypothetical protein